MLPPVDGEPSRRGGRGVVFASGRLVADFALQLSIRTEHLENKLRNFALIAVHTFVIRCSMNYCVNRIFQTGISLILSPSVFPRLPYLLDIRRWLRND